MNEPRKDLVKKIIDFLPDTQQNRVFELLNPLLVAHGILIPTRWIPLMHIVRNVSENEERIMLEVRTIIRDYEINLVIDYDKINNEVRDYYLEVASTRNDNYVITIKKWG